MEEFALFSGLQIQACIPFLCREGSLTKLTVEIPGILALRLEALAKLFGKGVDDLARKALEDFAGSRASRRAILKSRRDALDSLHLDEVSVAAVEVAMKEQSVERDRMLGRCDIEFHGTQGVFERLFSYVKVHQRGIQI